MSLRLRSFDRNESNCFISVKKIKTLYNIGTKKYVRVLIDIIKLLNTFYHLYWRNMSQNDRVKSRVNNLGSS